MSSIDNRIVNMKFDNAQFEQGVAQTSKTLSEFNKTLGAVDNLKINGLDQMASSVDNIANRFSFFGDLAFRAMGRVKEAFLDMVQTMNSKVGFIVNPMSGMADGFSEYESLINNTKAITVGAQMNQADVEAMLGRMNEYADQTIYNFGQMVDATKKFINAGVDAKTSEEAIIGISNAAAYAGVEADKAGIAMYNFSQAMANGFLNQTDYRSINQAGFLTVTLKEQMIDAAVAAGTLERIMDKVTGEYIYKTNTTNNMGKNMTGSMEQLFMGMQYQWLSKEVMLDVLSEYSDRTSEIGQAAYESATKLRTFSMFIDSTKEALGSGWAETWKLLVGNLQEATEMWSAIGDSVGAYAKRMADNRNELLRTWKAFGGRTVLLQGIADGFNTVVGVIGAVKAGLRDIFPPLTVKSLLAATKAFGNFMAAIKPSEVTLQRIQRIFAGLAAVLDIILMPFRFLVKAVTALVAPFFKASESGDSFLGAMLEIVASIFDFVVAVRNALKAAGSIDQVFEILKASVMVGWDSLVSGAKTAFDSIFDIIDKAIIGIAKFIDKWWPFNKTGSEGLFSGLTFGAIEFDMLGGIKGMVSGWIDAIKNAFAVVPMMLKGVFTALFEGDTLEGKIWRSYFEIIAWDIVYGLVNGLKSGVKAVVTGITNLANLVIDTFKNLLGINSPSTVFKQIGFFIISGLVLGLAGALNTILIVIEVAVAIILKTFSALFSFIPDFSDAIDDFASSIYNGINSVILMVGMLALKVVNTFRKILGINSPSTVFFEFGVNIIEGLMLGLSYLFEKLVALVAWIGGTVSDIFIVAWDNTLDGLAAFGEGLSIGFAWLKELVTGLGDSISDSSPWTKLVNVFNSIINFFKPVWDWAVKIFGPVVDFIISEIKMLTPANIAALMAGGGTGFASLGIYKFLTGLSNIFNTFSKGMGPIMKSVNGVIEGFADIMKGVGDVLESFALRVKASALRSIAVSILMLAGAMLILSFIPTERLAKGLTPLVTIMGGLILAMRNLKGISLGGGGFISLAIGIGLMAVAMASLAKTGWGAIGAGAGMWILLAAVEWFINETDPKKMAAYNKVLIKFSVGLWVLSKAIGSMGSLSLGTLVKGIAAFGITFAGLGYILKKFPLTGVEKILGLAGGMWIFVRVIKTLSGMDSDRFVVGLLRLGSSLIILGTALKFFPKDLTKVSAGLVGLSVAMLLLVAPIYLFGSMGLGKIVQGFIAFAAVLLTLAGALWIMKEVGDLKVSALALIGIAVALTLLAIPIAVLGSMDPWMVAQGIMAIIVPMLALAGAVYIMGKAGPMTLAASVALGVLAAAIAGLMLVIQFVGSASGWSLTKGIVALVAAALSLAGALYLVSKIKLAAIAKAVVGIGAIAAVLAGLMYMIAYTGNEADWGAWMRGMGALVGSLIAIFAAVFFAPPFLDMVKLAAGLGLIALAIQQMVKPMLELGKLSVSSLLAAFGGLAVLIIVLVGAALMLGNPQVAGALMLFGAGLAAVGWGLENVGAGISILLDNLERIAGYVKKAGKWAWGIIKKIFGVEEAFTGAAEAMDEGTDKHISKEKFQEKTEDALDGMEEASKEAEKPMAEAGEKVVASYADGADKGFRLFEKKESGMDKVVDSLIGDTSSIKDIGDDMNKTMEETVAKMGDGFSGSDSPMGAMPEDIQKLMGQSDTNTKTGMEAIANSYSAGNKEINHITGQKLNINDLPDNYKKIFESTRGQVVIGGEVLNKELINFKELVDETTGDIDMDRLPNTIQDALLKSEGIIKKDGKFYNKGIEDLTIEAARRTKANMNPKESRRIMDKYIGGMAYVVDKEGKRIPQAIGSVLGNGTLMITDDFLAKTQTTALDWVGRAVTVVREEAGVFYDATGTILGDGTIDFGHTVLEAWEAMDPLMQGAIRSGMGHSAEAIKAEGAKQVDAGKEVAANAANAITGTYREYFNSEQGTRMAMELFDKYGISKNAADAEAAVTLALEKMGHQLDDKVVEDATTLQSSMDTMMGSLQTTITTKGTIAQETAAQSSQGIVDRMKSMLNAGTGAGIAEQLGIGFGNGLEIGTPKVLEKVDAFTTAIVERAASNLGVESPSKVFMEIGKYVDQGLANGVTQNIPTVVKATSNLGYAATDSAMTSLDDLSKINIALENDLDPTITPILDLTNIEKGSKDISTLLRSATTTSAANAGRVSAGVNPNRQISAYGDGDDRMNTSRPNVTMNNTYNVSNESDARRVSNSIGQQINRYNYSRGVAVSL